MTYRDKFHSLENWKQKVLLVELFHLLMLSKRKGWNATKTANYFKVSIALVSENLKLAVHLRNGILDECKSRDKALKRLRNDIK